MPKNKKVHSEKISFMALLFMMSAMAIFSSDIYVAAFPQMSHYFNATPDLIKATVSLFFIGLGGSQLLYGPLSDYFGRKKIAILGLSVFIFGCILCAFSTDYSIFLLGRFTQGVGAGATTCLSRAIMRDSYTGVKLAQVLSYVGMGIALIPAIAPLTGGYIQYCLGWKFEFGFLFVYALILLALLMSIVPETNSYIRQYKRSARDVVRDYKATLNDPVFLINVLIASFFFAMIYVFYAMTSYYFQNDLHWSELQYSRISIAIAASIFLGRRINLYLIKKFSRNHVILIGTVLSLVAGFCMLGCAFTALNPLVSILAPMSLYMIAAGIVFPNTFVGATEKYNKTIGLVSSLYGFTQMTTIFLLITLSSLWGATSLLGIALMMIVLAGLSICGILYLKRGALRNDVQEN